MSIAILCFPQNEQQGKRKPLLTRNRDLRGRCFSDKNGLSDPTQNVRVPIIGGIEIVMTDALKLNKLFAGVLIAGLLVMGGIKLGEVLVPHGHLESNAYPIEVADTAGSADAPSAPTGPEPILALLANADASAGEKLAKKCAACHVFEAGGANKTGPALWNIVNADKGKVAGFGYSAALSAFGGSWDYAALNQFLYKPKAYISGTKMNFAGLKKPQDRANMIAWLRELSDNPAALPSEAEIAAENGS